MTEAHNDMLFGKIDGGNWVALSHWITGERGVTVLPASVLTDCLVRFWNKSQTNGARSSVCWLSALILTGTEQISSSTPALHDRCRAQLK